MEFTSNNHTNGNGRPKTIQDLVAANVHFLIEREAMTIYVRDHGQGFDPTCLADPLAAENLLKPSNRGIFLIRTLMDEVQCSSHPEGGCVVRMKKYKRSSREQLLLVEW